MSRNYVAVGVVGGAALVAAVVAAVRWLGPPSPNMKQGVMNAPTPAAPQETTPSASRDWASVARDARRGQEMPAADNFDEIVGVVLGSLETGDWRSMYGTLRARGGVLPSVSIEDIRQQLLEIPPQYRAGIDVATITPEQYLEFSMRAVRPLKLDPSSVRVLYVGTVPEQMNVGAFMVRDAEGLRREEMVGRSAAMLTSARYGPPGGLSAIPRQTPRAVVEFLVDGRNGGKVLARYEYALMSGNTWLPVRSGQWSDSPANYVRLIE